MTCALTLAFAAGVRAQDDPAPADPPADPPAAGDKETRPPLHPDPEGCRRLAPEYDVWIDPAKKRIVMIGKIVLREGPLELFACLTNTKEHESIVAVTTKAAIVHAGLLALGAEAGGPVEFLPEFKPPRGTEIEVSVFWTDPQTGNRMRARAQDWIREVKSGQAMTQKFVFAGSGFWEDTRTKQQIYQAEEGDFICVANFPSAMLDIAAQSSQANEALLFEAFTEKIPPMDTEVVVVLSLAKDKDQDKKDADK